MTGIDDWDRPALPALAELADDEEAQPTVPELVARVGMDQFGAGMARAWINDALSRGLIRRAGGSGASERYELTKKGAARLGDD